MFKNFFQCISGRLYKENDLSDITVAMVKAVPDFGYYLFKFFGVEVPDDQPVDIQREVVLEGNYRIDFLATCANLGLYIENKIYDRNYHFDTYPENVGNYWKSYTEEKSDPILGLISNHRLSMIDYQKGSDAGFIIKYWEEFASYLQEKYANEPDEARKAMIEGYILYLKGVCSMIEINQVDILGIKYAMFLKDMLLKVINRNNSIDGYYCKQYSAANRCLNNYYFGTYYELGPETNTKKQKSAWVFIGVFFDDEKQYEPSIMAWLDEDWNSDIAKKMRNKNIKEHPLFDKVWTGEELAFVMQPERFEEFQKANADGQLSILEQFFCQVNQAIIEYSK